jgi:fibronectin-binding autotransporter adhesin
MANRYWVGGSGNWTSTDTTNWSETSGGAGGASAPTSADDVIFDAGSDAGGIFTVTIGTGAVCRDITAGSLDFVMTLAGSAAWSISGSLTFPATNLTRTYTGAITFNATTTGKTITTNGVTLTTGNIVFNGAGGEWTLGSALTTSSGTLGLNNGLLDVSTSNYSITCGGFNRINGLIEPRFGIINILNQTASFGGGGLTYYNVSFTSTASGTHTITGANTFNDLTFTSLAATGIRNIQVNANQTVTGTLTLGTANTAIRRMFVRSDVIGTPRTITAATVATLADVDFRDIVGAGLGTWSGTRLGNCGGNTGITFDAAKTVYWTSTTGGQTTSTLWALTSGGTPDVNNFPLAQDTAIFDNIIEATRTVNNSDGNFNFGTFDFSQITNAINWQAASALTFYGNVILSNSVTPSSTGLITFSGASNQTVTSAGVTFTQPFNINKPAGTSLILGDALTSNLGFTLTQGTLDLNGFDLTCSAVSSNNSNTRAIAFGTGEINLTGNEGSMWIFNTATNFTYTGTPTVNLTYSGSVGTRNLIHANTTGGTESNAISFNIIAGTDRVQAFNGSVINNFNFTGFSGTLLNTVITIYGDVVYSSGMTVSTGTLTTNFAKSIGTQTLTTNGKTLDFPIAKQGAGTLQILDNTTIGSTRTITHTAGTIDLNDNTLTTGLYSSTGSTARQLDVGTGTLAIGNNFTASGSNYTTAGTGTISMTSASSKTFAGGGFTYPTLNQGGAGELVITGANTFNNITNSTQPTTVTFPANTNTSVKGFNLNGTAGNLVTIKSSTPGQQFTLVTV